MIEFSVYFSFLIYSKEKKKENHFSTKVHVIIKINATKSKPGFFFDARVTMKKRSTIRCLKRACIFHLILVGLPARLILFVKGLLTNDLIFLVGFVCQYFPFCSLLLPINRQTSISKLS